MAQPAAPPAPSAASQPAPSVTLQPEPSANPEPLSPAPAPLAQPAPRPVPRYSLPWLLRPVVASNAVRLDSWIAFTDSPTTYSPGTLPGTTVVESLFGAYRITPSLGVNARLTMIHYAPSGSAEAAGLRPGTALVNPSVGVLYSEALPRGFRLAFAVGMTLPVGMYDEEDPERKVLRTLLSGLPARMQMDSAVFATPYVTLTPGIDAAWIAHGFTVQLSLVLAPTIRARELPPNSILAEDRLLATFLSGLHLGYFIIPQLAISTELRYQRWIKGLAAQTPRPDDPPDVRAMKEDAQDNLSASIGLRGQIQLGKTTWFRPGIAFAQGLDKPLSVLSYQALQIDLPFSF